jgi:hypothetical protein
MAGAKTLADLTRGHVLAFANKLGICEKLAISILDCLLAKIVPSLTSLIATAVKQRNLGEVRTLREIHHNCILEMSGKLSKR